MEDAMKEVVTQLKEFVATNELTPEEFTEIIDEQYV